jgi:hypothetical protein
VDLPPDVQRKLKFTFAERVEQVLRAALLPAAKVKPARTKRKRASRKSAARKKP